jgi:hypothetical protein
LLSCFLHRLKESMQNCDQVEKERCKGAGAKVGVGNLVNLNRKKSTFLTSKLISKAFILALKDSAEALSLL